jgi:hypothetical protein
MKYRPARGSSHSALMFAARITLPIRNASQIGEPRLHLRLREGHVEFLIKLVDNFDGGVLRRTKTNPVTRLIARHKLARGRYLWQCSRARRTCHRQFPQLASLDVRDGYSQRREENSQPYDRKQRSMK